MNYLFSTSAFHHFKRKLFLLLSILISFHPVTHAQKKGKELRDSLLTALTTQKGNIAAVTILNSLAYQFINKDPDSSIYFAGKALPLATKLNFKTGIADAYLYSGWAYINIEQFEEGINNSSKAISIYDELLRSETGEERTKMLKQKGIACSNLGNAHYSIGNFSEAMKGFAASLKVYEQIGDKKFIASQYNNIGIIYTETGNYPEALKMQLAALKIREETGDKYNLAASYNNIGNIYDAMSDYREGLKNHFAGLKIRMEMGDKLDIAASYNNIGNGYDGLHNYPETLKNHYASLKLRLEAGNKADIASSYANIGLVLSEQGNYAEALDNYFASLRYSEEVEDKENAANVYTEIGNIYTKLKRYNDAQVNLKKGLQLSKEIESIEHIYNTYYYITSLDSATNNYKNAFEHHKLYIAYRDSLFNEENTKKLVQAQMQYDFDKRESGIKAEQDKKDALTKAEITRQKIVRNFSLAAAMAILGLSGYIIYSYRRRRKFETLQELANERLRISRELHDDIGSTLGSIAVYSDVARNRSLKNADPQEILLKIGTASRELIEKMSDIVWSLNPENETFEQLQNRMQAFAAMILTARNISFDFKNDEQLNPLVLTSEQRKNIFLIYKEALHNSVKYAECNNVFITISKPGNTLVLSIKDDGKGFDAATQQLSLGGNGLKNMRARASEMNAVLNIVSVKDAGTTLELKINI